MIVIGADGKSIIRKDPSVDPKLEEFLSWLGDDQAAFRVSPVIKKTADYVILSGQNGTAFSNEGSAAVITGTLPVATVGLEYVFVENDDAGNEHRVDPNLLEFIRGGGAGKYLILNAVGESVTLKCFKAGEWEIIASNGALTFEP